MTPFSPSFIEQKVRLHPENHLQHLILMIFSGFIHCWTCAESLYTCAEYRIQNWIDWCYFHHQSSNKKCHFISKTPSSTEFRRYSVDLFTKSVVLTLSSLVLYSESKTESIDTIFTSIHRTKSVSWCEKQPPARNLDDIQRIYSSLNLCWLSHYLCYTQNWKLNRLTPFSRSFIEQKVSVGEENHFQHRI